MRHLCLLFSWFVKAIGGENCERSTAIVTLLFSACFVFGRYLLVIPYWYIFVQNYNAPAHLSIKSQLPSYTPFFILWPAALDCINVAWGIPVLAITRKAISTLSNKAVAPASGLNGDDSCTPVCNGNGLHRE